MGIIENSDKPIGKQTEFLLRSIAQRLSGRDDCRNISYTVKIDDEGVRMTPLVNVFPDKFHRKETDRLDIVSYVHKYKMKSSKLSNFVFGTYVYETSVNSKSRKWRKID